jgi:hypothetical protein
MHVPPLFDLHADPHERLFTWLRTRRTRVTITEAMAAQPPPVPGGAAL